MSSTRKTNAQSTTGFVFSSIFGPFAACLPLLFTHRSSSCVVDDKAVLKSLEVPASLSMDEFFDREARLLEEWKSPKSISSPKKP